MSLCLSRPQTEEDAPPVSFFKVLRLNLPEWPYILVGLICATINGAIQPLFAILFSKIVAVRRRFLLRSPSVDTPTHRSVRQSLLL